MLSLRLEKVVSLIVYGHPASQPSRTVFWACLLGELPFVLGTGVGLDLGTRGTNPRGQVPSIADGDFHLAEAGAIVWYLSAKHGWEDMFPPDLKEQARVHQFINMHHTLVRLATYHLMAPHVVKPLDFPPREPNPLSMFQTDLISRSFAEADPYTAGGTVVSKIAGFLEEHYFYDDSIFLCGGAHATVADLVCYSEIGQFQFANLFDFTPYPNIQRWLTAMRQVPHHDAVNAYNIELGDIRTTPNTTERFTAASEKCIRAMTDTGLVSRP
jgi:glutathione S-transferase